LKPFKHVDVTTVKDALYILDNYKQKARIIAGGTDLIDELNRQIHPTYPQVLVNIKTIQNLKYIRLEGECLRIGVLTTLREIEADSLIRKRYNILFEAAKEVGTPQIRNMATLGGNLCQHVRCWYYRASNNYFYCYRKGGKICFAIKGDNRYHAILGCKKCFASFPSDLAVALVSLNAKVKIATLNGEKITELENFYRVDGTILKPNELITEIEIPRLNSTLKGRYLKFSLRRMDFAIASAAVVISTENEYCKNAKIVLGGVAPIPWRATEAESILSGKKITDNVIERASKASVLGSSPLKLNYYKISITQSLVKRAIVEALQN
jgi:xanthine dehydrogenase YagS FAD-binding subunit